MTQEATAGVALDDELLPTMHAARIVNRSAETIRIWAKSGRLSYVKLAGGQRLFRRSEIERLREELDDK